MIHLPVNQPSGGRGTPALTGGPAFGQLAPVDAFADSCWDTWRAGKTSSSMTVHCSPGKTKARIPTQMPPAVHQGSHREPRGRSLHINAEGSHDLKAGFPSLVRSLFHSMPVVTALGGCMQKGPSHVSS